MTQLHLCATPSNHLALLVDKHHIVLEIGKGYYVGTNARSILGGWADPPIRTVHMHRPFAGNPAHYGAHLHEFGHLLSPRADHLYAARFPKYGGLFVSPEVERESELDAWNWAKAHALFWNEEMEDFQRWALGTYGIQP